MTKLEYETKLHDLKMEHKAASKAFCEADDFDEAALKRFFDADKAIQELDREWCKEHGDESSIFPSVVLAAGKRVMHKARELSEGMEHVD